MMTCRAFISLVLLALSCCQFMIIVGANPINGDDPVVVDMDIDEPDVVAGGLDTRSDDFEEEDSDEIWEETESQFSLVPGDDEELSKLEGPLLIFSDYCVQSRDYIIGDIKNSANGLAAKVLTVFFKSAGDVGLDAINAQRVATAKLGNQLKNPEAEIEEPANKDDKVQIAIVEGQKKIQESPNQAQGFLQAMLSALAATKNSIGSNLMRKLDFLKKGLTVVQIGGLLLGACDQVVNYEEKLKQRFMETRKELETKDPILAKIPYEKIDCVTIKRISFISGMCQVAKVAHATMGHLLQGQKKATNEVGGYSMA